MYLKWCDLTVQGWHSGDMDKPQKGDLDDYKMTDPQKNSKKVSHLISENFITNAPDS